MRLFSPAKVNLFLGVLGRRKDGYREIVTLLQAVNFGDILHVDLDSSDSLTSTHPSLPLDCHNLILKAASLFRKKTGERLFIKVHIEKNIPLQAGLGGGSSNAATTLFAMNCFSKNPVPLTTLQRWSSEIGSDIPFFFSSGLALCTGRGEEVESLSPLPLEPFCIVKDPHIGLSTKSVYEALPDEPLLKEDKETLLASLSRGEVRYFNHLETPAFMLSPPLKELRDRLLQNGFKRVMMTGSGSALLCFGEGTPIEGLESYAVSPISHSPNEWFRLTP